MSVAITVGALLSGHFEYAASPVLLTPMIFFRAGRAYELRNRGAASRGSQTTPAPAPDGSAAGAAASRDRVHD